MLACDWSAVVKLALRVSTAETSISAFVDGLQEAICKRNVCHFLLATMFARTLSSEYLSSRHALL